MPSSSAEAFISKTRDPSSFGSDWNLTSWKSAPNGVSSSVGLGLSEVQPSGTSGSASPGSLS